MIERLIGGYTYHMAALVALVVGVLTWDSSRKAEWMQRGKERARVEQQKATDEAIKQGSAAADLSRTGGVQPGRAARRKLPVDPTTRHD